jgi:hypothetical protein
MQLRSKDIIEKWNNRDNVKWRLLADWFTSHFDGERSKQWLINYSVLCLSNSKIKCFPSKTSNEVLILYFHVSFAVLGICL